MPARQPLTLDPYDPTHRPGIPTLHDSQLQVNHELLTRDVTFDLGVNLVRFAPIGTNMGLFQIRFQYIWLIEPNVLKSDLKKSPICPIWGPI